MLLGIQNGTAILEDGLATSYKNKYTLQKKYVKLYSRISQAKQHIFLANWGSRNKLESTKHKKPAIVSNTPSNSADFGPLKLIT